MYNITPFHKLLNHQIHIKFMVIISNNKYWHIQAYICKLKGTQTYVYYMVQITYEYKSSLNDTNYVHKVHMHTMSVD